MLNAGSGAVGNTRYLILALANAMVGCTEGGFCGGFNARVNSMGVGVAGARGEVKAWITPRII